MTVLDELVRAKRDELSEEWTGTCPQCGRTVSNLDDGNRCPGGCHEKLRSGVKVPYIIQKSRIEIIYRDISSEEMEILKVQAGGGIQ